MIINNIVTYVLKVNVNADVVMKHVKVQNVNVIVNEI